MKNDDDKLIGKKCALLVAILNMMYDELSIYESALVVDTPHMMTNDFGQVHRSHTTNEK